jgi:hypothetical protein
MFEADEVRDLAEFRRLAQLGHEAMRVQRDKRRTLARRGGRDAE